MKTSIPINVLLRAQTALQMAKASPTGSAMPVSTWMMVMKSHAEMEYHLTRVLTPMQIAITDTHALDGIQEFISRKGDATFDPV